MHGLIDAQALHVGPFEHGSTLTGHLLYVTNDDVPGVMGYIGSVTGKNNVNIAALSMGRQETPPRPGEPQTAVTLVETDHQVSESLIAQMLENKAVREVRIVEFRQ